MEKRSGSSKCIPCPTNSTPTTEIHSNIENPDSTIWVSCPYCCNLFEYEKKYENCKLRCQNCRRGFHAVAIPSPPPIVPGMDAYYCSWGFFPLGSLGSPDSNVEFGGSSSMASDQKIGENVEFSSWKPFSPMFGARFQDEKASTEKTGADGLSDQVDSSKMTKEKTYEEPLLAVPINMRHPKKKKAAKKVQKKQRAVCERFQ
ncbi:hypothetical protein MRB53_033615 [Persea americana]|uniref:Uncharacterized protein n=1 Tax=Persea americana TaxID=3435 RepID=A0ACC2KVU2_PERAE|nr:hypothetical protein MRB53_033615 [Persea americana]